MCTLLVTGFCPHSPKPRWSTALEMINISPTVSWYFSPTPAGFEIPGCTAWKIVLIYFCKAPFGANAAFLKRGVAYIKWTASKIWVHLSCSTEMGWDSPCASFQVIKDQREIYSKKNMEAFLKKCGTRWNIQGKTTSGFHVTSNRPSSDTSFRIGGASINWTDFFYWRKNRFCQNLMLKRSSFSKSL